MVSFTAVETKKAVVETKLKFRALKEPMCYTAIALSLVVAKNWGAIAPQSLKNNFVYIIFCFQRVKQL